MRAVASLRSMKEAHGSCRRHGKRQTFPTPPWTEPDGSAHRSHRLNGNWPLLRGFPTWESSLTGRSE